MIAKLTDFCSAETIWTAAFAAAVDALRTAGGGVLLVPAGEYLTGPIRLYSNMELHLEPGAVIRFLDDAAAYPMRKCQYEGRVEMRPAPCLSAYGAENVTVSGHGVLDGGGEKWWQEFRASRCPRPYLLHFEDCTRLTIRQIQLQNSPAWTVHPLRCKDVVIEAVTIHNPYTAPNTDGINPESCRNVRILGCCVDVGDDCITLKSGTEETPSPAPCENILIADCCLVHGHGGIVIGSEMSGSVRNVTVTNCVFTGTDRGLRVKTRRRRGGAVENITISNLVMEKVFCPFVFNMYYSCGTSEADRWVWDKSPAAAGPDTPVFRNIRISGVTVEGASAAAGFFYGLAESPIENLTLTDCDIRMDADAKAQLPAMMGGLEPMRANGMFLRNLRNVRVRNVQISGALGPVWDDDDSVTGLAVQG